VSERSFEFGVRVGRLCRKLTCRRTEASHFRRLLNMRATRLELQRQMVRSPIWTQVRARARRLRAKRGRRTRDQFETINARIPGNAVTLHGPEGKENHHHGFHGEICKTSTPGSNPSGASKILNKNRRCCAGASRRRCNTAALSPATFWTLAREFSSPLHRGAGRVRYHLRLSMIILYGILH